MAAGPLVGTYFYSLGNRVEFVAAAAIFGVAVLYAANQFRHTQPEPTAS